jgi:GNAT superfamily N-acetyltransferase
MKLTLIIVAFWTITNLNAFGYEIKILTGSAQKALIPFIAAQRIKQYQDYPYLYDGNMQEETDYVAWCLEQPSSALAVAYIDDAPIGFASGISLVDFDDHMKGSIQAFTHANFNPHNYYYLADIMVVPAYQGNKISSLLLQAIENHARNNAYKNICCITENHDTHPFKPIDYVSVVEVLLSRFSYVPSSITLSFEWLTRQADGSSAQQTHILQYWIKSL